MKKLVFGFAVAMAAFSSQAAYLWWQLDDEDMTDVGAWAENQGYNENTAVARVVALNENKERVGEVSSGFLDKWYTIPNQQLDLSAFSGDVTSYSYYVEIVSKADPTIVLGQNTGPQTYQDLVTAGSITTEMEPTSFTTWHGGTEGGMRAAPEPTSAMLMLLGVAGLALKRKQKKA